MKASVTHPSRKPSFDLRSVDPGGRAVPVPERAVLSRPFGRLVRFERPAGRALPRILLVAPLSGNFPILLRDTVGALLAEHDVYLTDWTDAREVPPQDGPFGLDDNIGYTVDFLRHLGPGTHLIGLCQSVIPSLAATAVLAAADDPAEPLSLTLIAGPVDSRIQQTRVARLIADRPLAWFERNVLTPVPAPWPGRGRPVYPAAVQRRGFLMYLTRHLAAGRELHRKVLFDDGDDPQRHPFLSLYLTLMDLPAEVFLDTMKLVFHEAALAQGRLTWRGQPGDLAAIRRAALLTVEGERDDIVAPGQTHAAQALCRSVPAERRRHHLQMGVGHFGTFHGVAWRHTILPRLTDFMRASERSRAPRRHKRRRRPAASQ